MSASLCEVICSLIDAFNLSKESTSGIFKSLKKSSSYSGYIRSLSDLTLTLKVTASPFNYSL